MGSSSSPTIQPIQQPAESVVAAVAKDPEIAQNTAAHEQARSRKRGIASSYNRYGGGNTSTGSKEKLGV